VRTVVRPYVRQASYFEDIIQFSCSKEK